MKLKDLLNELEEIIYKVNKYNYKEVITYYIGIKLYEKIGLRINYDPINFKINNDDNLDGSSSNAIYIKSKEDTISLDNDIKDTICSDIPNINDLENSNTSSKNFLTQLLELLAMIFGNNVNKYNDINKSTTEHLVSLNA